MRLNSSDFEVFWREAARPVPVVIVGGGRWGRVWASVISGARKTGSGITIVARQNHSEAREWMIAGGFRDMTVTDSIASALNSRPRPEIAIIASRPRDHVRDALEVLSAGIHVLVEKPIASVSGDAARLVLVAASTDRLLGVGTEFALLPAFHQAASVMETWKAGDLAVSLEWEDPVDEVRHGIEKATHEEIDVLGDLLPHALSIFRILKPNAGFTLSDRRLASGKRGGLVLRDREGCPFRLSCNAEGTSRRRFLHIESGGVRGSVDFSSHPAKIVVQDNAVELLPELVAMDSTLRLEFGAFLAEAAGLVSSTPLTSGLDELVALHAALEVPENTGDGATE